MSPDLESRKKSELPLPSSEYFGVAGRRSCAGTALRDFSAMEPRQNNKWDRLIWYSIPLVAHRIDLEETSTGSLLSFSEGALCGCTFGTMDPVEGLSLETIKTASRTYLPEEKRQDWEDIL